jgi:hypothetical protein
MRFKIGIAIGFAAGYWAGSTSPEERRAKLDELREGIRGNPRLQRVTDTMTRDARRLGDAVEQRLVGTADGAVNAIAGSVEPADKASDEAPANSSRARSA